MIGLRSIFLFSSYIVGKHYTHRHRHSLAFAVAYKEPQPHIFHYVATSVGISNDLFYGIYYECYTHNWPTGHFTTISSMRLIQFSIYPMCSKFLPSVSAGKRIHQLHSFFNSSHEENFGIEESMKSIWWWYLQSQMGLVLGDVPGVWLLKNDVSKPRSWAYVVFGLVEYNE